MNVVAIVVVNLLMYYLVWGSC